MNTLAKPKMHIEIGREYGWFTVLGHAPKDSFGKITISKKTVSIHHYAALWQDEKGGNTLLFRRCVNLFGRKNGEYIYQIIKRIKRR